MSTRRCSVRAGRLLRAGAGGGVDGVRTCSTHASRHYRDQIVPLRRAIAEEMLLRYNGMPIGVFELLADARDQVSSVNLAIEADRDFWLAESHLRQALVGGMSTGGTLTSPAAAPAGGGWTLNDASARSCTTRTPTRWCKWRWA